MKSAESNASSLMTVAEAAEYLRLGVSTLNNMRVSGGGPAFLKLGPKRVVYDLEDLKDWLVTRRRKSTSEL